MYHIKELMQPIDTHESSGICHEMSPLITPIFKSTLNFKTPPLCHSCQFTLPKCLISKFDQPTNAKLDQQGALSEDSYEAGNFISADQCVIDTPGRLLTLISLMVTHCFMILLLVSSWLSIKSL